MMHQRHRIKPSRMLIFISAKNVNPRATYEQMKAAACADAIPNATLQMVPHRMRAPSTRFGADRKPWAVTEQRKNALLATGAQERHRLFDKPSSDQIATKGTIETRVRRIKPWPARIRRPRPQPRQQRTAPALQGQTGRQIESPGPGQRHCSPPSAPTAQQQAHRSRLRPPERTPEQENRSHSLA